MAISKPVLPGQGEMSLPSGKTSTLSDLSDRRKKYGISFPPYEQSKVKPEFQKECDINTIVSRFKKTGLLTHVRQNQGQYGDFISVPDYHDAMNQILAADEMFFALPADLRSRFENDPATFLDFAQNPANEAEMEKLGLIVKAPAKPVIAPLAASGDAVKENSSPVSVKS